MGFNGNLPSHQEVAGYSSARQGLKWESFSSAQAAYLDISELVTHLDNIEDPAFACDAMGKTYEELFGQRMSHIMDRNVCWDLMSRPFVDGKDTPLVQDSCSAFDELRQCIEEMRRIDALSEIGVQRVRDGYYEGRIPQQINPWWKK